MCAWRCSAADLLLGRSRSEATIGIYDDLRRRTAKEGCPRAEGISYKEFAQNACFALVVLITIQRPRGQLGCNWPPLGLRRVDVSSTTSQRQHHGWQPVLLRLRQRPRRCVSCSDESKSYFFPISFFICAQVLVLATSALVSPARRACRMPNRRTLSPSVL